MTTVATLVACIQSRQDLATCLPQAELRAVFDAAARTPDKSHPMLDGVSGLPRASRQLVAWGIFEIHGDELMLASPIQQALHQKEQRFDTLLMKLQQRSVAAPL